jgi:serine O-acetyltransferase
MAHFEVSDIVRALHGVRDEWRDSQRRSREPGGREFPSRDALAQIVESLKGALFPMRLGPPDLRQESEDFYVGHTLDAALQALLLQARLELNYNARLQPRPASEIDDLATEAVRQFANALPDIRSLLDSDVLAAYQGDPAARSVDEVLLCYPGVLAMIHYRLAHNCTARLPLLARIVAELAHGRPASTSTPGADRRRLLHRPRHRRRDRRDGRHRQRVRLYQAVTLGAKRFPDRRRRQFAERPAAASGGGRRRRHLRRRHRPGPRHAGQGRGHRRQRLDDPRRAPGASVTQASSLHGQQRASERPCEVNDDETVHFGVTCGSCAKRRAGRKSTGGKLNSIAPMWARSNAASVIPSLITLDRSLRRRWA